MQYLNNCSYQIKIFHSTQSIDSFHQSCLEIALYCLHLQRLHYSCSSGPHIVNAGKLRANILGQIKSSKASMINPVAIQLQCRCYSKASFEEIFWRDHLQISLEDMLFDDIAISDNVWSLKMFINPILRILMFNSLVI